MTRQILKTRWRDIPFEEIDKKHFSLNGPLTLEEIKDKWNDDRGKELEIYLSPIIPEEAWCDQPSYQRVDKPYWVVCPCLVEIGD